MVFFVGIAKSQNPPYPAFAQSPLRPVKFPQDSTSKPPKPETITVPVYIPFPVVPAIPVSPVIPPFSAVFPTYVVG